MRKEHSTDMTPGDQDDMQPEYDFDYRKARPNRFAPGVDEESLIVVLEPDIASVFKTPDSVKDALRKVMASMTDPPEK